MDKLIKELHKVFDIINETKYNNELIPPVITVQRNTNKKNMVWGHCSCLPRWIIKTNDRENHFYEINISFDSLARPYEDTLGTLIHEIAHLSNSQKGIEDCNPHSQHHNEKFKIEAERLGLIVEKSGRRGFSQTALSGNLLSEIESMNIDKTTFDIFMADGFTPVKTPKSRKPTFKYRCPCCNKELKSTEEELVVSCVNCDCEYMKVQK